MATKAELRTAAEDMVFKMKLEDGPAHNKKPIEVTFDMDDEALIKLIKEAIPMILPTDKLKMDTLLVIKEIKSKKRKVDFVPEEEIPPYELVVPDQVNIKKEIREAERMKDFKDIANAEPVFKSIRGILSSFKTQDELKAAMIKMWDNKDEILATVVEEVKEEVEIDHEFEPVGDVVPVAEPMEVFDPTPVGNVIVPTSPPVDDVSEPAEEVVVEDAFEQGKEAISDTFIVGTTLDNTMMETSLITTRKPFKDLFIIREQTYQEILESMRLKGFDPAFPIILWNNVVIDGHTRLKASIEFGLFEVPVIQKEFADEHEALEYAIHNQRARRNITEAELLKCIQAVDNPMTKEEAGKKGGTSKLESKTASETSHKKTAKTLGISESKVSDARAVLTDVEAVQKVESGEKISMVAKEVREKKKKGKPVKEKVVENPTRIKSVCGVLKFYAESDMPYEDVLIEANEYFHENGGTSNMAETTKTANMVVEVLEFFGYVSRIGEDIKIGKF